MAAIRAMGPPVHTKGPLMDAARLERDACEQMQAGKVPGLALAIFDDRNEASIRLARRQGFRAGRECRYLLWPKR